ncbi:MAG: AmmeMemoRadiSam system protein B [Syntrophorhabdaceae bacterium]|nr:AmmeMemoRadiSam system protein B [Syntrophorhabdaceae bacterium]MDD4196130.1 AmmeMemoRadiSam system protein B [Syntrophorhabdaceae bacterium]HOC45378.1 AmmeMemoRadiSam system protein B [Syntrophorhabdaceae bacterium]
MEKPRIRFIEAFPYEQNGKQLVILRDAEGISREALAVSRHVALIVSLMDGTNSLRDIQAEFMRVTGEMVSTEQIEDLVKMLDQNLFLQNDRYMAHVKALHDEYDRLPVRPAYLAGTGYSANRMDLLSFLDGMFDGHMHVDNAPGEVSGILAPHIDYSRGASVYGRIYPYLKNASRPLMVILGTCHRATRGLLSISLKDFETPLETVPVGPGLKDLVRGNNFLNRYIEEWPHRIEHSIELQLPLIQFMVQHDFEILPVLTGSMHEYVEGAKSIDDDEIRQLTENLKHVLEAYGKPYCIIAGADLAHIGAQFGDLYPIDATVMERSRRKDEALLGHIRNADADAFFMEIKEEGDQRRICGLTPIFFQLKLLAGCSADIVDYDQWTDGHSSVSFAGGFFSAGNKPVNRGIP